MCKFLSVICFAAVMFALSPNVFWGQKMEEQKPHLFQSGLPLDEDNNMLDEKTKYPPAYTAPASIEVNQSWDMYVSAAFTYWYASQDAMDLGYVTPQGATPPALPTQGAVVYQNFGYAPGFQLGVGVDTHFDDWTVEAQYTWYDKTQSGSTSLFGVLIHANDWFTNDPMPGGDTCGFFCSSENSAQTLASKWKLQLNQLDLVLGRPFYEGKKVTFSPVAGLRSLWIKQNMNITMTNFSAHPGAVTMVDVSSNSWAIGPAASLNTKWLFWNDFRFEAVMGSSLLYTRYTSIKDAQTSITSAISTTSSSVSNLDTLRPTMNMGLGLGYGSYFCHNKFFIDFSARYDFMQLWSQNVMRNFTSELSGRADFIGDLRLHGLTVNLRWDF